MTLEKLMKEIGCTKWPEVWQELYPVAKANLVKGGYPCLDEGYYDYLDERYDIFGTYPYKDVFKEAAQKTAKNKKASLFLALILETLKDREHIYENLKALTYPDKFEGEEKFVFAMLRGLAFLSMADYTAGILSGRGIPDETTLKILKNFPDGVATHRKCHDGEDGFMDFDWNQRMIDGNLLPIKRLVAEVNSKFNLDAAVFVNSKGEAVTLGDGVKLHRSGFALGAVEYEDEEGSWIADITETEESYTGYPYTPAGIADKSPVTLLKSEWTKVISKGDKVVDLHIPAGGGLTPELVDETLRDIKAFLKRHYPEYHYEAFCCWSWLCDPQLIDILGPDTNISKFTARFKPVSIVEKGTTVLRFVFNIPDGKVDINDLPENTTLERKLKKHFLSGGHIYGMAGYFLKGDV